MANPLINSGDAVLVVYKYTSIVKEQIPDMPVDRYSQILGRSYQG